MDLQVTVAVTSNENMFCINGGTFDVAMTVEGEDAEYEFWGDISPTTLEFTVEGPAVYGGAGGEAWTGEDTVTFSPRVGDGVNPAHLNHQLTVRASYGGDQPGDCVIVGAQEWSENEGAASINIQAEAPEEEEEENGDNDNNGGQDQNAEEGPAPAVALVLVVTILIVALRRR